MGMGSNHGGDREGLIRAYDEEEAAGFGLTDLAEDTDEDDPRSPMMPPYSNGNANGNGNGHGDNLRPKTEQERKSGER